MVRSDVLRKHSWLEEVAQVKSRCEARVLNGRTVRNQNKESEKEK